MPRFNLLLLSVLTICAIGLVTSQHKARRLVTAFEQEQSRSRALETEYRQLQLEASTWSMHSRVERLATERLQMRATDPKRTQLVPIEPPTPQLPSTFARSLASSAHPGVEAHR